MILIGMLIAFASFTLSACVGLGGSLLLVPAMALAFGTKTGIAVAAILLSLNNIGKVFAYRHTIPFKAVLPIVICTMAGASVGATAMLFIDEFWVDIAVIVMVMTTFWFEFAKIRSLKHTRVAGMAFGSGLLSGFSGTSGPLKGLAIRSLGLERMYFVGAASMVSLFGDAVKAAIFTKASLMTSETWMVVGSCIFVIPLAVFCGKKLNTELGEKVFAGCFWAVMTGYSARLLLN